MAMPSKKSGLDIKGRVYKSKSSFECMGTKIVLYETCY